MENKVNMDLAVLPYSTYGSYMVLSEIRENFRELGNSAGLYLRSVHGSILTPLVAKLELKKDGAVIGYHSVLDQNVLILNYDGGKLEIAFADDKTLMFRGTGEAELVLDYLTETGPYDYIYEFPYAGQTLFMANNYKNNCSYLMFPGKGEVMLDQKWEESSSLYSRICFSGKDGFEFYLKEIRTEWDHVIPAFSFEEGCRKTADSFAEFWKKTPAVPEKYEETAYRAAYLNWSTVVKAEGFMKRDGMFMSKNWMLNVWSWDHCFNAMALSYENPDLAWDQFMVMFDFQDEHGRLPDSINDVHVIWNYSKPPIHGWALRKMMKNMTLSAEQKAEAFRVLSKWTEWWLNYRDYDQDGICEYNHGNDSGWDNSTAFSVLPPVATAELQAFLVIQMEVLAELAKDLGMEEEEKLWMERSNAHLEKMLEICFRDDLPLSIRSGSHEIVENESLLPFVSIVLGKRLPEEKREKMLSILMGDKFFTAHGFATEAPESPFYRPDGYWRGPIWAPSTMLILDGIASCGEVDFVKEASRRFADMVSTSGFAENFDALTGEGLRDRAYTWTSSVFLILTHEYLM